MATLITCNEHIAGYSPPEVFDVGTEVRMLPTDIDGFLLNVDSDSFAKGVIVQVGLALPGRDFNLTGKVKDFIENERVLIEARSRTVANVDVWIGLSEHEEGGTNINYGIKLAHSPLTKMFEVPVRKILNEHVEVFVAQYSSNVVNELDTHSIPRHKKAA